MPLIRCTKNGEQVGWKWGESGTCFPTREEALRQARAILASQNKDEKPAEIQDSEKVVTKARFHDER